MTPDPYAPLFIASATAIVSIIGTLTVQWALARSGHHESYAAIHAANAELKKHVAHLEAKDSASQIKITEIQAYIDKHLTHRAILAKFTVEPTTGDLLFGGLHFCTPCFHDGSDPPFEIQMAQRADGQFVCPKCNLPTKAGKTFKMPGT